MSELDPRFKALSEIQKKRSKEVFPTEVLLNGDTYKAEMLVQSLGKDEVLQRPSMENFIRLFDDSGVIVATADDIRELNHNAALVANILGNTYTYTEMLILYPNSQRQSVQFSSWLKKNGMLGKIRTSDTDDNASLTMPDGFYYEYTGTSWEKRPVFLWQLMLTDGLPYREDMQYDLTRRPDYRVPADFVMEYMIKSSKERAISYADSLERYSSGALSLRFESSE